MRSTLRPRIDGRDLSSQTLQSPYLMICIDFGSSGEGHMFPGVVSAPFANVKLGPDVYSGKTDAYAGYLDSGNITAFSLMHQSGIGGAPKYGVVAQQPVVGKWAEHAGMFSYQFPEDSQANVVVNLSHYLSSSRGLGTEQHYVNGSITIQHDDHHRPSYTGSASYKNGWNLAPDWIIYFCGHFDSPSTNNFSSASGQGPHDFNNRTVGATFSFADRNVTSRVGVSWISIPKACQFVDDEIPTGSTIDDLAAAAKDNWNAQIFSNIKAETKDSEKLGLFYSSLYGMNLMPSNRTGENPLWESSEPYYDDIVTLWDLFRSATPLIQILQPVAYEEQIRSMIDIWRHDGYMPDGRSSNFNGRTQGGSNADNVLADAYVKDVVG
ncbi:MAG: hypothetical protein Q9228_005193 [Teloschistes exilis]